MFINLIELLPFIHPLDCDPNCKHTQIILFWYEFCNEQVTNVLSRCCKLLHCHRYLCLFTLV